MIRGTKRKIVETPTKRFDVGASIHNRFDIEVVDAVSGKVKQKVRAENVICDQLWSRLFSGSNYNSGIHYGDGSGTPSPTDTSLFSFLGYIASSTFSIKYDYDIDVYSVTKKAVLLETEAIGKTITEVGIAYGSTKTNLVTHAMLKDMNGNPVSLTKTSTDIFNVYATVFVHLNLAQGVRCFGTTTGTSITTETGYYNSFFESGLLAYMAGLTGKPSMPRFYLCGGYVPYEEIHEATISYDPTGRVMTVKCPRIGTSNNNQYRGIKNIFLGVGTTSRYPTRQVVEFGFEVDEGSSWYPKTEIQGESIGTGDGVTVDYGTKINFAKNVVVKVDSVPVESVVDFGCARGLGHYFRLVRQPAPHMTSSSGTYYPTLSLYDGGNGTLKLYSLRTEDPSKWAVYENVLHETHGVKRLTITYSAKVSASNDLSEWVELGSGTALNVPEAYQGYRYWCIRTSSTNVSDLVVEPTIALPTETNIHLSEAPPEGAVITADYDAICIGKDENHVFDFSVTFQFNEYTEAQ